MSRIVTYASSLFFSVSSLLDDEGRAIFRSTLSIDDGTWTRARGWAASQAVGALAYYTLETNPVLVLEARRWLAELLR